MASEYIIVMKCIKAYAATQRPKTPHAFVMRLVDTGQSITVYSQMPLTYRVGRTYEAILTNQEIEYGPAEDLE